MEGGLHSDISGYAECGNIDHDGHGMGLRLAGQLVTEVTRIAEYVLALKAVGWPRLRIVTDHGWLLMPGGFEPIRLAELPSLALRDVRIPDSVVEENERILIDGFYAEVTAAARIQERVPQHAFQLHPRY